MSLAGAGGAGSARSPSATRGRVGWRPVGDVVVRAAQGGKRLAPSTADGGGARAVRRACERREAARLILNCSIRQWLK